MYTKQHSSSNPLAFLFRRFTLLFDRYSRKHGWSPATHFEFVNRHVLTWSRRVAALLILLYASSQLHTTKSQHRYSFHNNPDIDYSVKFSAEQHPIHRSPGALFTFIIPCYKQVDFLKQSMDSITFQKWFKKRRNAFQTDVQIIVVFDEPRTDQLLKFCANYVKRMSRYRPKMRVEFKFIFKNNGGLADARNAGLQHSIGKWIITLDADDKILKDFFMKFERLISDHDVSNQSLTTALDHVSIIAPSLLIGETAWPNQDLKTTNVLYQNLFHCSVIINRNFLTSFRTNDAFCQWWQEPYFFFGWEDWNFWMRSRLHLEHVLYVRQPWVFYSSGQMHRLCVEHRTYCLALFRVANSDFYSQHKIWEEMRYLSTDSAGIAFETHSRWNSTLESYGGSFPVPLVWASLFSLRQNKTTQALEHFAQLLRTYDRDEHGVIETYGRFLQSHIIQNSPVIVERSLLYQEVRDLLSTKKSKILFCIPDGTRQPVLEDFLQKIPKLQIPEAYSRVAALAQNRSHSQPEASYRAILYNANIKPGTIESGVSVHLKDFGSLFSIMHASRIGLVSTSMTRMLLENKEEIYVPDTEIYRISKAKWHQFGSDDLMVGWKARTMMRALTLKRREIPKAEILNHILDETCEDMFGNKMEHEFCQSLLILYDAHEYSKTEVVEAVVTLSNFVPKAYILFEKEHYVNEYGPLVKFRRILKLFLKKGCIPKERRFQLHISPLENVFFWWVSRLLMDQSCGFEKGGREGRTNSIHSFLSKNSWTKTESCSSTFVIDQPRGELIHFFFSDISGDVRNSFSMTAVGSALHLHPKGRLVIHTDSIEVRESIRAALKPEYRKRVHFSYVCDTFLSSTHSSRFIQEFIYEFGDHSSFSTHQTHIYRYLVLHSLGGIYAEGGIIFFKPSTGLRNFVLGESRKTIKATVMKFDRWHPFIGHLLNNFQTFFSANNISGAGSKAIHNMLQNENVSVRVLPTRNFYPISQTNLSEYSLEKISSSHYDRVRKHTFGIHATRTMLNEVNESKIKKFSFLGRLSDCGGCHSTLIYCPIRAS